MKLLSYDVDGDLKLGLVHDGRVADLLALAGDSDEVDFLCCARCFLEAGDAAIEAARALVIGAAATWPLVSDLKLAAPITDPGKILALAGNYREHIRESREQQISTDKANKVPDVFMKPATCIIGTGEPIVLPGPICTSVDYEGELGVVIGKACHYVRAEDALDCVAGYVNINDVSGRKLNIDVPREITPRTGYFDWLNGKWFDTFAPIGPYLVLKDEIPDPQVLDLELRVNGQVRQKSNTGEMIFSVAEAVAWISQFMTLEPGDIIATGTPEGVGVTTGTFLKAGDVVELEISGLGLLRNQVVPPMVD
jgi:2-keto-4-pentenoate hydratase/2-oxohepta-3-ene-1,7-dioic acid hydratase in catechol pathway